MMNNFFSQKGLVIVICFALFLRIMLFLVVQPYHAQIMQNKILANVDARQYQELAVDILHNRSFSGVYGAYRTPGYPFFIAVIYSIFGIKPWVVLLLQLFLNSISLALVYLLGKEIFDKKTAIIAAALYALDPHTIFYSVNLMSDTLFTFIFLAAVLFLLYGLKQARSIFFLFSGCLFGVGALIRPLGQYFPLAAAAIILIYAKMKWRSKLKAIAILITVFMLVISPWLCRNYFKYGHLSLSCMAGEGLFLPSATATLAAKTQRPFAQISAELKEKAAAEGAEARNNPFDNSGIYSKISIDYIISDWKYYLARHLRGIFNMFINLDTESISNSIGLRSNSLSYGLMAAPGIWGAGFDFFKTKSPAEMALGVCIGIILLVSYLAFVYGSFLMLREKKYFPLLFILIIILYFSSLTGVIGLCRYKLPLIPFYLLVSSQGIIGLFHFLKVRPVKPYPDRVQ